MQWKPAHKQTRRVLAIGGASSLVLLLASVALFYAVGQREEALAEQVENIRAQETQSARAQKERHVLAQTGQKREKLNRYFVTEESIVPFIESLEVLARRAGAELKLHNVQRTEVEGRQALALTYTARGGWEETSTFLGVSEVLPASVLVDRVHLRKEGGGNVWALDMSIVLLGFGDVL